MARVTRRTAQAEQVIKERAATPAPGWSLSLTQTAVTQNLPPGFRRSVGGVVYCEAHGLTYDACFAEAHLGPGA
jgi:hypothetical protein